ncbi:MAG: hypothetical protein A2Y20_10705 [Firmicutes bacterium GWF2_51_9]|nr:MAG: hypothetical protein A2Y20_10705 [Firmicutes bacterium GWF2_51_9]OGS59447.1 MAG: hypothetical protein A2Y19_10710 [Firmicutes bacterium GWE2_51_13]HAM62773.1 hypothetical protein [Erysipelotrichaceae bacterium]HBZ42350.1 hypothetical protein [Erysipelotrichaceae bacterium]
MNYSEEDFENIYRATFTPLSKYVLFKVQSVFDAQDLVQDVYYDLYKRMLKDKEIIENPLAYLMQMANHALTRYYKEKSVRPITLGDEDASTIQAIPDEYDLESDVLDKVSLDELWDEVARLPELDQKIIVARFRFDLRYVEIANALGIPESTVKSRMYKALEILKKKFLK